MEFFIFLIYMSVVSFAMAFVAYAIILWLFGANGKLSRYAQIFFIPIAIIGWDLLTITRPIEYRYYVGGVPMAVIAIMLLYYRFVKGGNWSKDDPTPMELAGKDKKPSAKAMKYAARKNKKKGKI